MDVKLIKLDKLQSFNARIVLVLEIQEAVVDEMLTQEHNHLCLTILQLHAPYQSLHR